jgi:phage N-6-adenine-methyltransferase
VSLVGFQAQNHPQQAARDDVDDRATEPAVFATFESRFGVFTLDVAAAAHNTKCSRYFTRDDDGTAQPWAGERVWCNPPYSDIAPWVHKAWDEHAAALGIVMLLPANRTEQRWWQDLVEPYRDRPGSGLRVEFLPGRMRFLKPGQQRIGANERPPFGVCLLVWSPPAIAPASPPGATCSGCRYCDPQMPLFGDPTDQDTAIAIEGTRVA